MRVVVDTNVLVSGLLCPYSPSGAIVRTLASGELLPVLDARVVAEYSDVLKRPRFAFDVERVALFLEFLSHTGEFVAGTPLDEALPDPDDEPFLEVAIAGGAACLVTGNTAHFPPHSCAGVGIVTPRQFIELWKAHRKNE